jgi:hypothetical protein
MSTKILKKKKNKRSMTFHIDIGGMHRWKENYIFFQK